jgi:hypothetical protein
MMEFGFCNLAVVPVRSEPSDKAEMSTQLLFGDMIEVIGHDGSWCKVKILFDGYEGWVDAKQIRAVSNHEFKRISKSSGWVNRQLFSDVVLYSGVNIRLPAGCSFYNLKGQVMQIDGEHYQLDGKAYPYSFTRLNGLLQTAAGYMHCPYLWGGKTYLGLDCSGFTQVVYKQHGIKLLRDAGQQATQGELISILNDGKPGDLAFFDNAEGKIVHVGILLEDQRIIHCSGKVRIDAIDHQGIYNRYLSKYTHNLRLIRRVIASSR